SLKGDEFRRVIIRPRRRISQSTWANMYFYRDLEFDDIEILEKRHGEVVSIGVGSPQEIAVKDASWASVNGPVKFVGDELLGSTLVKNETYFITSVIINSNDNDIITVSETEGGTDIDFTSETGKMFVVADAVSPFLNQINDIQGYFGRFYLENPYKDINVGVTPTNDGNYNTAAAILQANRAYIQEEIIQYVNENIDEANSTNDTDSIWYNFTYDSE
ncbi:MAG: hypothetical protein R6X08_04140, partial [Desulfosalsimonadaceae bacterium]